MLLLKGKKQNTLLKKKKPNKFSFVMMLGAIIAGTVLATPHPYAHFWKDRTEENQKFVYCHYKHRLDKAEPVIWEVPFAIVGMHEDFIKLRKRFVAESKADMKAFRKTKPQTPLTENKATLHAGASSSECNYDFTRITYQTIWVQKGEKSFVLKTSK